MVRVRCLSAAQDLLLQSPVLQQTQQHVHGLLEGSLLQRLHSSLISSLAGGYSLPAAAATVGQCRSSSTLPIQQQQLQQSPSCWQQSRAYAGAARFSQRSDRTRQDRYQPQQPRAEPPQLQLGRQLANCIPTELIRQQGDSESEEGQFDSFKERDPLLVNPRQVRQHSR
jgi:hypothetical protein